MYNNFIFTGPVYYTDYKQLSPHPPAADIVNGTYGKRSSVYAQSMCVLCVCYASITEMNSTDRLSASIVGKNDRSMFQSQRRTRQHSTDRYVARVHVLHA